MLDRYLPALRRVARQHDGQTVAIFSHGATMRIVLGTLQGLSLLEIGDTPFGDNTSVARLEVEGDDIRVLYRDDNTIWYRRGSPRWPSRSGGGRRGFRRWANCMPR